MSLDLGTLNITIGVDDQGVAQKLDNTKRKLDDVKQSADQVDNSKLNISADTKGVDNAKTSTTKLGTELDAVGKKKIKPDVDSSSITSATQEAEKFGGVLNNAVKWSGGAAAVAGIGAIGTVLTKGFSRLESIDTATFKLQGLGHGAESVSTIMDSALASVSGTAFGLGDAVTSAANAVASGVKPGAELTQVLTTMADVSAISGAELTDMGMIFNSVLAKGKLQGDDMLQLLGRGVPVLQMIGDELGVTAAEASQMATDGEISFQIFESAMRNGMGGAAQEMGASMAGSMDNAGAAMGRLGAAIADPVFAAGPGILAGFTDVVDTMTTAVGSAYGMWERVPGPVKAVVASLTAVAVAQKVLNTELGSKFATNLKESVGGLLSFDGGLKAAYTQSVALNPQLSGMGRGLDTIKVGAGNAGSSLMAAFGGPWGLAIAGATAAIGLFIGAVQKSKQEQADAAASTDEWANVLTEADGKITDSVQKHALLQVEQAGVADEMDNLGLSAADLAAGVLDLDGAYEPLLEQLDAVIEAGMKAPTAFQGRTYTDAAKDAMVAKDALMELRGAQESGQEQAEESAKAQGDLAERIVQSGDAADGAGGKFSPFATILDEMSVDVKSVDDAIQNLSNSLMGLSEDPEMALQGYLSSALGAIQDAGKALEKGKGGFSLDTGMFDLYTEQGRTLEGVFSGLKEEMYDATAAQYELAQSNGVGGVEASKMAADRAAELSGEMRRLAENMGWSKEEVDKLIDSYNLAPEVVMTELHLEGVEHAQTLLDSVDWSMAKIDAEESTIVVDASAIKLTEDDAKRLGVTMEDIGSNLIEVKATGEQAKDTISEVYGQVEELGARDNPIQFRPDVDAFARDLAGIDGLVVNFTSDPKEFPLLVDDEQARRALDTYKAEYVEIDGMLYVEDNSPAVMNALLNLGATTASLPQGNIIIEEPSDEILTMLGNVGFAITDLPGGQVLLDHQDIRQAIEDMDSLGFLVEAGADGRVEIDSNAMQRYQEQQDLKALTEGGAKGSHVISDNVLAVRQRIEQNLVNKVTYGEHRINVMAQNMNSVARAARVNPADIQGPVAPNADGNIWQYAQGGVRENHVAQIAKAGDWRVWAEDETGGEAYIPLAPGKRGRSTNILEEVARRFGKALVDKDAVAFADGGISEQVKSELSYLNGTPYVFGGWSPAGTDCSGAVSLVANVATGRDPWEARTSTHTMDTFLAERGFVEGQGGPGTIRVGWKNGGPGGGHTALTLDDGTNIESGGNTGGGFTIGGRAAPGNDPQFTDFMYLPLGDQGGWTDMGGEAADLSGLEGIAGGGSGSGRSGGSGGSGSTGVSLTKTINGGAGTLVEDGSLLELAAAAYSAHTGMPMADDIVSWGNVMGLGTTFEGEDLPGQQRDLERGARDLTREARDLDRKAEAIERDEAATLRDIEQAKDDLRKGRDELNAGGKETGSGDNKKFEAYTEAETKERMRKLEDQIDKIRDLEDKLIDIEDSRVDLADSRVDLKDSQAELIESQELLRTAIEKATAREVAFGGMVTPMADGGILGSLSRNAQISDGSSAVLWAEAGPEAYIPLSSNKRAKSTDIWMETGKRLGFDVMGMLSFLGAGASGLVRGDLDAFSTGSSFSLSGAGLNAEAASHMGQSAMNNAVGAAFYGPVQINDPKQWAASHLDDAQKMIHTAMKGMRNG